MPKIMIIDDFLEDRFFLERLLSKYLDGLDIVEFAYGEDALAHLRGADKASYDLIFVDINMLRMNGFEFADFYLSMFTKHEKRAELVLVSGTFDPDDVALAEAHPGILGLLQKPITSEDLGELLSAWRRVQVLS